MEITQILIVGGVSAAIGKFVPLHGRMPVLVTLSIAALFWLQPTSPVGTLRWLFPFLTLLLVGAGWWVTQPPEKATESPTQNSRLLGLLLLGCLVGMVISSPDDLPEITRILAIGMLGSVTVIGLRQYTQGDLVFRKQLALLLVALLIAILLILKTPGLVRFLSASSRYAVGLDTLTASISDIQWLGISYIVFRLMAMLLDFRNDRLPAMNFQETLLYVIFPAALPAGPIDQAQRFVGDVLATHELTAERMVEAGRRITMGLFKKFVVADSLALVALSTQTAEDARSMGAAWLIAYLYAFQIFYDFSGYTDIAIGLGKLVGFDLPENFDRPYLRQNLAQFWQNWHMTLTRWFRTYFFVPFTRALLRRKLPVSDYFLAQLATMTLIGLWHGVTGNFVLWGLWHAVGLYIHKQISDRTRPWYLRQRQKKWANRLMYASGVFATFHFVVVGWVFFALPEPSQSFEFLQKLFGL